MELSRDLVGCWHVRGHGRTQQKAQRDWRRAGRVMGKSHCPVKNCESMKREVVCDAEIGQLRSLFRNVDGWLARNARSSNSKHACESRAWQCECSCHLRGAAAQKLRRRKRYVAKSYLDSARSTSDVRQKPHAESSHLQSLHPPSPPITIAKSMNFSVLDRDCSTVP